MTPPAEGPPSGIDDAGSPAEHDSRSGLDGALARFVEEHREAIIDAGTSWVIATAIDLQGRRPREETRRLVARVFDSHLARLLHDDPEPQRRFIEFVTSLRATDQFHISTLIRGFLSFRKGVEHILPRSSLDPAAQLRLLMQIDTCSRDAIFEMSDLYVGKLNEGLRGAKAAPDPERARVAPARPRSEPGETMTDLDHAVTEDGPGAPSRTDELDASEPSPRDSLTELFTELLDRSSGRRRVGPYEVQDVIGRGGMGAVLEAYDERLDRKVAIKLLHPEVAGNHARRLVREAKALAKLSHPNVVQVYEVGEHHGQSYIAMELVTGMTLNKWQRMRPGWRECVALYAQAGAGLAAAHSAGLTHRDFKPDNCIVDREGRVRVLDFGLVRGIDDAAEAEPSVDVHANFDGTTSEVLRTKTGAVLGTLAYMSLEQLEGRPVDARSDQFSFCVSLFEALYGERPFEAQSVDELVKTLTTGRVRLPPKSSGIPKRLDRLVRRGLHNDPEDRWPSMDALLTELDSITRPRRKGHLIAALAIVGGASVAWLDGQPRATELGEQVDSADPVEQRSHAARVAARRGRYLYPPADDPRGRTAYLEIIELEAMAERLGPPARTAALQLRREMALALAELGDRSFEQERALAVELYAAALAFDPTLARARSRAAITDDALQTLQHQAATSSFALDRLEAMEPLAILARLEPDPPGG